MKKSLFLFFAGLFISGFAFSQEQVKVSGHITKPTSKNVIIYYYTNIMSNQPVAHRANLDEDGGFSLEFELEKPMAATFRHGRETSAMFIHPGDNISVSLNPNKFDETITYKGIGPGVAASNFLAANFLKFEDSDAQRDVSLKDMLKEYEPLEFQSFMESEQQIKDTYFGEYASENKLSKEFVNYFRNLGAYKYANQLMSYKRAHAYLNEIDEAKVQIPSEYYEFLDKTELMNLDAINMPDYITFLDYYLNHKSKSSNDSREDVEVPDVMRKFNLANKYLSDMPLLIVSAKMIKEELEYGNPLDVQDPYSMFMGMYAETEYGEMLAPIYEAAMKLAPGQPAPDIALRDIDGNMVELSDFKGRVVYLDFWASWCGPCRAEMPHAKKLKQYFEGQDVVFLYVSIDDDENAWKKAVEEENLKGVLLYSKGFRSEVPQAYNIKAIPNYFLINRDGTIALSNPDRPSGKNLIRQISKALNTREDGSNGRK